MRLGFIGTGKIASSVITGVCTSKISFQKILVSRRNKNIAQKLKKRFREVYIAKNNQEIVDKCNWIFLAVTPQVGKKILTNLKFRPSQKVISFIATINLAQLKKLLEIKLKLSELFHFHQFRLKKARCRFVLLINRLNVFLTKLELQLKSKMRRLQKTFGQPLV